MKKHFILANLVTLASLFCAFYSINAAFNDKYFSAIYTIILAFLFDGLDGKVARALNTASDFGKELDSLTDAISFGVAPAFLFYKVLYLYNTPFGFILPFFYTCCVVLRLARFNITSSTISEHFFVGLPAPAGAIGVVAFLYFQLKELSPDAIYNYSLSYILFIYLISFLMISKINYLSFKNIEQNLHKKIILIIPVLFFALIFSLYKPIIMLILILCYIASGPATLAINKLANLRS
jgi:CDP-diacylglycerol--serine O-phosphatidyltransferase